jgi:hypothetical protein
MADSYWGDLGTRRQVLLWAMAARRQLDRWEPLVARKVWGHYPEATPAPPSLHWEGESEHCFAIVAMDHMLEAVNLWGAPVPLSDVLRLEIPEVRDLLLHWKDNMPVFRQRPRPHEPARSTGKRFAARNPNIHPYDPLAWSSRMGARLTWNVSGSDARAAIAAVQGAVLGEAPDLALYLVEEAPSPWHIDEHGNYWPLQVKDRGQRPDGPDAAGSSAR